VVGALGNSRRVLTYVRRNPWVVPSALVVVFGALTIASSDSWLFRYVIGPLQFVTAGMIFYGGSTGRSGRWRR
jgi:hypothetical protein